MIARWSFAVLDRIRSVPGSTWAGTALGVAIGWGSLAVLTDAPMNPPVAVGFILCAVIAVCLCIAIGVVLVRSDEQAQRLEHLEIRAERLPELPVTVPEDETPEAEGGDWYARLKAGAEWVDGRMRPTFLEPEPAAEPVPAVRPSPVPREPAPATVPLERAWEESAAELTEQQQWEAERDAKWAAIKADIERMAKGVASDAGR